MTAQSWLTLFHPRSIRSLIYMVQTTEYRLSDYWQWVGRVTDFRKVEQRKHLVWTAKAKVLYVLTWIDWVIVMCIGVWFVMSVLNLSGVVLMLVILLCTFILSPVIVAFNTWLLNILQQIVERWLVGKAREKLAAHPATKIAIAGSYGKTSMREILRTVIGESRTVAAPGDSVNTPLGIAQFINRLQGNEEVLIFELGEYYPGDVRTLCHLVQPDMGVITGASEAHLSKFKTMERTVTTLLELAEWLGPNRPVLINGDDEYLQPVMTKYPSAKVYCREGSENWKVSSASTDLTGLRASIENGKEKITVQSALLGLHNMGSIVAAVEIGTVLGLSADQIESGIAKTKPYAHRLQPQQWANDVLVLDDSYNGNPAGARAVIAFLAGIKGHRRWYVTPGLVEMGTQSDAVHQDIGRQLASGHIKKIILLRTSVTPSIAEGLKSANYTGEIIWFDDMPSALKALPNLTLPADVVLIQNDWPDQYA